jgi:hypothetical protein
MARSERFELPTLGFEVRCSIQLSYERVRGSITRLGLTGLPKERARSPQWVVAEGVTRLFMIYKRWIMPASASDVYAGR